MNDLRLRFILCIFPLSFLTSLRADDSNAKESNLQFSIEELTSKLKPSVVVVTVPSRDAADRHLGSGFAVAGDLIATNLHVVGEGRPIGVKTFDGRELQVTRIHAFDRASDLAILQVDAEKKPLTPLLLADSDTIQDGSLALAIGNPLGLRFSVVSGVISAKRLMDGRQMLQLAMPIEPGNSGGPVIDANGKVQGVVTMKSLINRNLGFAVSINTLKPLMEKPNPIPMSRWLTIGKLDHQTWEPLFGARWHQRGGKIFVEGTGEGFGGRSLCLAKKPVPEPPYECVVHIKLDNESGAAGIVFDCDEKLRHYGFYPSAGNLRLSRFDGPTVFTWNVLREVPTEHYRKGDWNHLRIRIEKDKVLCYVNGQLVIESTDRKFQPGRIGLAKFRDTRAEFKGFKVGKDLSEKPISDEQRVAISLQIDKLTQSPSVIPSELETLIESPRASTKLIQEQAAELEKQAEKLRRLAEDVRIHAACKELGSFVKANDGDFDLLKAALLIARLDKEDVDVESYLHHVDRMAQDIRATFPKDADGKTRLSKLNDFLFKDNGFHGNRFDYYHRTNSYINRVIDDRVGLPISLSVLYMELGKRLELKIEGVGLPGHFVVKWTDKDAEQFVDVFDGGKYLSQGDVENLVQNFVAQKLDKDTLKEVTKRYSQPATKQAIVERMLANLRGIAERERDTTRLLPYLEALVAIDPINVEYRGIRSWLRYQSGRCGAAISDLDWFLEHKPEGLDLNRIRQMREQFMRTMR